MFTLCQRNILYVATIVFQNLPNLIPWQLWDFSWIPLCSRLQAAARPLGSLSSVDAGGPVTSDRCIGVWNFWGLQLSRVFFGNLGLQVHRGWPRVTIVEGVWLIVFFVFRFSSHFESSLVFFWLHGGYSVKPRKVTFSLEGGEVRSSTPMVSSWVLGLTSGFPNCVDPDLSTCITWRSLALVLPYTRNSPFEEKSWELNM